MAVEDFEWALRPFFVWLHVLGIDFRTSTNRLWPTLCFVGALVAQLWMYTELFNFMREDSGWSASHTIDYSSMFLNWLSVHLSFLALNRCGWTSFRRSIASVDFRLGTQRRDRRQLRIISVASIVFIIVTVFQIVFLKDTNLWSKSRVKFLNWAPIWWVMTPHGGRSGLGNNYGGPMWSLQIWTSVTKNIFQVYARAFHRILLLRNTSNGVHNQSQAKL